MDKKAKQILFNTYWSKSGWKENTERHPSPEDFIYAKEKGLMFDPFSISHDDCVKNIVQLGKTITTNQVARAFLSSLSTRRLDWRSAIASYSVAKKITIHKYTPVEYGRFYDADNAVTHIGYTCAVCQNLRYGIIGQENYINVDLNVLNFERIKWGGVRHGQLIYTLFDLQQFAKETIPQPQSEDIEIFREILKAIKSCDPTDYPSALSHKLAMIPLLKSNKDERNIIIEILACIGILAPKSYNRPEAPKHDWTYAAYWRGEDGYNKSEVERYFGEYL